MSPRWILFTEFPLTFRLSLVCTTAMKNTAAAILMWNQGPRLRLRRLLLWAI